VNFILNLDTPIPDKLTPMVVAVTGTPILASLFAVNLVSGTAGIVTIQAATSRAAVGATSAVAGVATSGTAVTTTAVATGAGTGAAGAASVAILSAQGLILGSIGLACYGADKDTWDCWKPILMDNSVEPSRGITLRDLSFVAENIRNERFRLSPVLINDTLAFHANRIQTHRQGRGPYDLSPLHKSIDQ
jgi:hypothetical protein